MEDGRQHAAGERGEQTSPNSRTSATDFTSGGSIADAEAIRLMFPGTSTRTGQAWRRRPQVEHLHPHRNQCVHMLMMLCDVHAQARRLSDDARTQQRKEDLGGKIPEGPGIGAAARGPVDRTDCTQQWQERNEEAMYSQFSLGC